MMTMEELIYLSGSDEPPISWLLKYTAISLKKDSRRIEIPDSGQKLARVSQGRQDESVHVDVHSQTLKHDFEATGTSPRAQTS